MKPKVLIVDNMPDASDVLPEWFQREGYETVMATRGQQALALAEERHPGLILLDVMLPGMDGIETCRRLRMNPATADIPVILVSARSPAEARAEGLLAGATDYITKPIHFPDLLERIQRIAHLKPDERPDHRRLLEEMAYTALTVLPCNLAWMLIVDGDNRWLLHQSIATDRGAEAAGLFLRQLQGDREDVRYALRHGDNPLAEVLLNRQVAINIPLPRLNDLPGGPVLFLALSEFNYAYVSLLPLITSGRAVGVMVLATMDTAVADSRRAQQILNSLSNQAAMAVDNARLLTDLAAREGQMRAEQAFRQMVMDTMGEGLIVVDSQAVVTYVNNRLLRMTDYTREMLYGRSVGLLFHPSQREKLVNSLTGERRGTLPFSQQLFTRHGEVVPVLVSRAVAPAGNGKGSSTVMVVTDLSELQRNEDALKLQTQRLQAINHAANAISSAHSFQEVISISLESALKVVQGVSAALLLRDADHPDTLAKVATVGPTINGSKTAPMLGEDLASWVVSTGKSQLVVNTPQDGQTPPTPAYGPEVRSLIAVPLVASDEVIGVLKVVNKDEGVFDEQDLATLESLAGSAAVAIENARLFDQMRRRVTELSTLLDASAAVTSTLDFGDILERIARRLSMALQVERVVITDWHRPSNHLGTLAEVVNAYWAPGSGPLRPSDHLPMTRTVFETGALVTAIGPANDETTPAQKEVIPSGLYTIAAFPIRMNDIVVGAVTLHSETPHPSLAPGFGQPVADVVARWQEMIQAQDPRGWLSRSNLTDLCQRVLQASGARWCCVLQRNTPSNEIRLLREIGRALWLAHPGNVWDVGYYPSMARVLAAGEAATLQRDQLLNDLNEEAYLRSVGGGTCLVAPLFIRGEPSGLVKLVDCKRESRTFDSAELSLCQGIANVVGNAMENAKLYAAQEQRATALEAAYTELQDSDRLKDDLLQNLSHELRTPLTHILGYLRLLSDSAFGALTPDQTNAMNLVGDKAQQLADLVKDILSVQQSEAHNLTPKAIHLERVVALAIRSIAGRAQARGIRLVPRIPTNLPLVRADPARVGEVIEELLENAIKFSPNSSQIEVILEDPGGPMLHASVCDYGIGIHPDEHEKIFRRFYQVDSGTTRRFGGTGLGLAIVKQVVEGHGGRVWVESEPGKGSCFRLTLPKVNASEQKE